MYKALLAASEAVVPQMLVLYKVAVYEAMRVGALIQLEHYLSISLVLRRS